MAAEGGAVVRTTAQSGRHAVPVPASPSSSRKHQQRHLAVGSAAALQPESQPVPARSDITAAAPGAIARAVSSCAAPPTGTSVCGAVRGDAASGLDAAASAALPMPATAPPKGTGGVMLVMSPPPGRRHAAHGAASASVRSGGGAPAQPAPSSALLRMR